MKKEEKMYADLRSKLHNLRRQEKKLALLSGGLLCLALFTGMLFFVALLEAVFRFSSPLRIALGVGVLVVELGCAGWWIGRPFLSLLFRRHSPDDDSLAFRVGEKFPSIKDRLTDGLQVFRTAGKSYGTSSSLALASLSTIFHEVASLPFHRVASKDSLKRSLRAAVVVFIICAVCTGFFPKGMAGAFVRISHPRQSFPYTPPFQLTIHPGDLRIVEGGSVEISAEVKGRAPERMTLFLREEGETIQEKVLQKPYLYPIRSIKKSTRYFVRCGKVLSPTYRIEVLQRPMVQVLQVITYPPLYSGMAMERQEPNTGEVDALKGTEVQVSATANKDLSAAALLFEKQKQKKMKVRRRDSEGSFRVSGDDRYWIQLTDTLGLTNFDPISYAVRMRPDLSPLARIVTPGKNVDLDETMELPLALEAEDDFGISQWRLFYWVHKNGIVDSSQSEPLHISLPLQEEERTNVLLNFPWNLEELKLLPEDMVSYGLEVFDNDRVSGPKRARSPIYTARFPSMYEMYQEVEREQSHQYEVLQEIYGESQSLRDELERISEDMKAGKTMDWEERKYLGDVTEKQKQMEKDIEQLTEKLEEVVDRMERNDLVSLEVLEKYQELENLYQELSSPELLEAMKKLKEALSQISPEALKEAAEKFKFSQEGFLKSLERTLALLKRLQVEQKTDELIKRIEDMIQRQERVNQDTPKEEKPLEELVREESAIRSDAEDLRQEMETLYGKMEEFPGMPLSQLEAAINTMDREDFLSQLQRAEQMMGEGRRDQAVTMGTDAAQAMQSVSGMLKEMQKRLRESQKEKVANQLKRASYRTLQLSQGQETLLAGSEEGRFSGNRAVQTQMSLLSGLSQVADSLVQLSQQTFFVTPEMGRAIGQAQTQMKQALQNMGQSKGASAYQSQAMAALNRVALEIQKSMDRLANSQSGLGMEEFLLQIERMAQQQMGINQQTLDLVQKGRLTLEEQAAMARLAGEQEAVKRTIEELLKEFGNRSEITGRLNRMIQDMEEVIQDLKKQEALPETVQRQERILSRLLDVQHSLRRQDYSKKRQAKTGQDVIRRSPETLSLDRAGLKDRIRRDILRMAQEGYTKEYLELIQKYFEALAREKRR